MNIFKNRVELENEIISNMQNLEEKYCNIQDFECKIMLGEIATYEQAKRATTEMVVTYYLETNNLSEFTLSMN
jgi:hypothetical protein